MNIKTLHKAQPIYQKLAKLDGDIIAIEKIAQSIADNNQEISLTLTLPESVSKDKKPVLDADGSLTNQHYEAGYQSMFSLMGFGSLRATPEKPKNTFEQVLTEVETLAVLGVLVQFKKQLRKRLLSNLEKLGYTI